MIWATTSSPPYNPNSQSSRISQLDQDLLGFHKNIKNHINISIDEILYLCKILRAGESMHTGFRPSIVIIIIPEYKKNTTINCQKLLISTKMMRLVNCCLKFINLKLYLKKWGKALKMYDIFGTAQE
jgi:hypothetical protein